MPQPPEHAPGETAPEEGEYEQVNIFGRPIGIRVSLKHGNPLPEAPIGHAWRLVEGNANGC
jgi:hypothetical protein